MFGFLGQGLLLLLQGHTTSSKGLMAEAGGQPAGHGRQRDGAGLGSPAWSALPPMWGVYTNLSGLSVTFSLRGNMVMIR